METIEGLIRFIERLPPRSNPDMVEALLVGIRARIANLTDAQVQALRERCVEMSDSSHYKSMTLNAVDAAVALRPGATDQPSKAHNEVRRNEQ